jgi:hypothetical protein
MEKDEYEAWVSDLEQNDDNNDVARVLHKECIPPSGDPRVEALFRRATRGNGHYSQLLRTYGGLHN